MIVPKSARPSLYLIRHGETSWTLTGQHTGRTDMALTEQGEKQACELVPWLRFRVFTRVFSSPRLRARRTCELAGLSQQAEVEPDLAEWDYGDYEGKTSSDIRKHRPDWIIFRDGCPGGETPAGVSARADRLVARLNGMGGSIALFSHGQFGAALAARWIGLSMFEARHFSLDAGALGVLGYNPAHPDTRVIDLWNASPARCPGASQSLSDQIGS